MRKVDLIISNIGQLLTMADQSLQVLVNNNIVVDNGLIVDIGDNSLLENYSSDNLINASNKVVTPGLIDCHTHLVFAGSREREMLDRMNGKSYLDILKSGGGIISTVKSTCLEDTQNIFKNSQEWLDKLLEQGVTTVEIKSGYGLSYNTELRLLKIIESLKAHSTQMILSTFLAHAFPLNCNNDRKQEEYINIIKNKMLINFKRYAEFFDIFIEDGSFSFDQADRLLSSAKSIGYKVKMHVNQINNIGGVFLARKYNAISVDHLDVINEEDIILLSQSGASAVLLPSSSYFLDIPSIPDVAKLSKYQIPLAIASNFNPGSCPSINFHLMMSLAIKKFKMTIEQVWLGVTINAAKALGKEKEVGSIEIGKKAHIVIWDMLNYLMPFYHFGHNLVDSVIIGKVVKKNRK